MEIGEGKEIHHIYVGKYKQHIPRLILYRLTNEPTEKSLIVTRRKRFLISFKLFMKEQ